MGEHTKTSWTSQCQQTGGKERKENEAIRTRDVSQLKFFCLLDFTLGNQEDILLTESAAEKHVSDKVFTGFYPVNSLGILVDGFQKLYAIYFYK